MNIVVFGSGPMPCEPRFAVTAPGARTWQIAQTVAHALLDKAPGPHSLTIYGLEASPREEGSPQTISFLMPPSRVVEPMEESSSPVEGCVIRYVPLAYEPFVEKGSQPEKDPLLAGPLDAVIGCASVQPCSTAAHVARRRSLPFWADIFGDPFSEIQSKAELYAEEKESNDQRYQHVWRLYMPILLQADAFSALSERQRYCLIGQLGAAGRLNRLSAGHNLVHTIPYGVFAQDVPAPPPPPAKTNFIIVWSGSFNTWMDVDSLVGGVSQALQANPQMRLLVIGGKIPGYNEVSYDKFVTGIRASGVDKAVQLVDWQPLAQMRKLYALADVGLSIDRFTYEAETGSRTRIVNFLGAGKPVLSTVVTELTLELADKGFVLPFRLNDASDLTRALLEAARNAQQMQTLGQQGRQYVLSRFLGQTVGKPLASWIVQPGFAPDKSLQSQVDLNNPLTRYWEKVLRANGGF